MYASQVADSSFHMYNYVNIQYHDSATLRCSTSCGYNIILSNFHETRSIWLLERSHDQLNNNIKLHEASYSQLEDTRGSIV